MSHAIWYGAVDLEGALQACAHPAIAMRWTHKRAEALMGVKIREAWTEPTGDDERQWLQDANGARMSGYYVYRGTVLGTEDNPATLAWFELNGSVPRGAPAPDAADPVAKALGSISAVELYRMAELGLIVLPSPRPDVQEEASILDLARGFDVRVGEGVEKTVSLSLVHSCGTRIGMRQGCKSVPLPELLLKAQNHQYREHGGPR